jgi:hypothetical protein
LAFERIRDETIVRIDQHKSPLREIGIDLGALDRAKAEPIGVVVAGFDLASNLQGQINRGGRHLGGDQRPDRLIDGRSRNRLAVRLSTIADPGNTITPIGGAASVRSFRLKSPVPLCQVQSGLKAICTTFRCSAWQAAMRSARLRPALWNGTMWGFLARALSCVAQMRARSLQSARPVRATRGPGGRRTWVRARLRAFRKSRLSMSLAVSARRWTREPESPCQNEPV